MFVQTHKVKCDSLAVSSTGLPTCVFTSRRGDPVCCPRFTAYWITSRLKQSSPKKAKDQAGLKPRPSPSALDPGERSRSDTRESLSSMSSEQSGLICSSWAPGSPSSLTDRNSASEGLSSLPPAEWSPPSMTPASQLSVLTPRPVNRDSGERGEKRERRGTESHGEQKKQKKLDLWGKKTHWEIKGWCWGYCC